MNNKLTKEQAIELATKDYRKNKKHNYAFNVPARPQMGYSWARVGEIGGKGINEVWNTSKLWKPLLMKTMLVWASLRGDKTETRSLAKPQPKKSHKLGYYICDGFHLDKEHFLSAIADDAPYKPGDLLYVREKWQGYTEYDSYDDLPTTPPIIAWWHETEKAERDNFRFYFAFPDYQLDKYLKDSFTRWLPSIHMPKRASRLWLEVTNCYPQFLNDITGDQCLAEGIMAYPEINNEFKDTAMYDTVDELHRMVFAHIWDEIAGKNGVTWADNPIVWVTEYKRVDYGPFVNGGE